VPLEPAGEDHRATHEEVEDTLRSIPLQSISVSVNAGEKIRRPTASTLDSFSPT
jgi:hypothetical protein